MSKTDNSELLTAMDDETLVLTARIMTGLLEAGVVGDVRSMVAMVHELTKRLYGRGPAIDVAHLERQRSWSTGAFGPGRRTAGVIDHIIKELAEIAEHPTDLYEWVDVIILALDGAWRAGHEPDILTPYEDHRAANQHEPEVSFVDAQWMVEPQRLQFEEADQAPEPWSDG